MAPVTVFLSGERDGNDEEEIRAEPGAVGKTRAISFYPKFAGQKEKKRKTDDYEISGI